MKNTPTLFFYLLTGCPPPILPDTVPGSMTGPKVWHQLADTPVTISSWVALHGKLLAVGGKDSDDKQTTAIHIYNTKTNSWEVISHMATPPHRCLLAVLPHNELMAVGGWTPDGKTDTVEIATIV